ncbi:MULTISPECIES: hypothetical protein [unclassified Microcoleus]|uniref:hypothetical protein n=1 Tax=unclassified Microcoleus TaxID=2642155 RepID=UPI0025D164B8|nr:MULTISPECIES: hypothetical protein [unclassified Microcoleus]
MAPELILAFKTFYLKELVESPPAGSGSIKIRLFIIRFLGLNGRVSFQTVNCQLSTVNC